MAAVKKGSQEADAFRINRIVIIVSGSSIFIAGYDARIFLGHSAVGCTATDWVGNNLFGRGLHVFGIGDAEYNRPRRTMSTTTEIPSTRLL